jgi:hypothetical protein
MTDHDQLSPTICARCRLRPIVPESEDPKAPLTLGLCEVCRAEIITAQFQSYLDTAAKDLDAAFRQAGMTPGLTGSQFISASFRDLLLFKDSPKARELQDEAARLTQEARSELPPDASIRTIQDLLIAKFLKSHAEKSKERRDKRTDDAP